MSFSIDSTQLAALTIEPKLDWSEDAANATAPSHEASTSAPPQVEENDQASKSTGTQVEASDKAPASAKPQSQEVSHEKILRHEETARQIFHISELLYNGTAGQNLPGKPALIDVLKRVNEFGVLSSDIAICGESIRHDSIFFRAIALLQAGVVEGRNRTTRAANAVRKAREDTRAEYEARKAARETDKERSDMKRYFKKGSLKP